MNKFTITGFSDEISPDFQVQLNEIERLDIAYIEIRGVNGKNISDHSIEEVEEIKKQLDAKQIKISAIGSPIGKIKITDEFQDHFEKFKHTVKIAKNLGTHYIRLFSFFIEEGRASRYRDEVLKRLKAMVNYAEAEDIILLHENEKDIYGDSAERCLDLYKSINSENFKLIFDPANFVQCGVKAYPDAFELLKDHVVYYHIKDAIMETGEVVPSGFGDGHLSNIIEALVKRDYVGFLSLEPHLGDFVGFSDLEGDGDIPEFKESSDVSKFQLSHSSLMKIIQKVEAGLLKNKGALYSGDKIRIGVVGIGNMGSSHCHKLFDNQVNHAKLVAVCDIKEERLTWAKENFAKDILTYKSIEELIESKSCDAIIIATPHYDHPIMGIQGLKANLHILVEKPIGVYTKAVEDLNNLALKSDKVFTIMYNQRTNPVYQKVKAMIDGGEIGKLIRVNWVITNWFRSERYYQSGGWRATWEGEGGGVLLNQCPHQIDLIQWMCGLPKRVRAFAKYGVYHDIEVEDDVTAYFEYEDGGTGMFITSTGEAPGTNRLEISGENGKLVVENDKIIFYKNKISVFDYSKTTEESFAPPEMEVLDIEVLGKSTDHVGIMQDFVNTIIYKQKQLSPGVEGIHGLSLSNAMHMSSWLDTWVDLPIDGDKYYELLQEKIKNSAYKKVTIEKTLDLSGSH